MHNAIVWQDRRTADHCAALKESGKEARVKQLARALAEFQTKNPDCNAAAMQAELLAFLRKVAGADQVLDKREELAIDAVAAISRAESELSLHKAGRNIAAWSSAAGEAASGIADRIRAGTSRRPVPGG